MQINSLQIFVSHTEQSPLTQFTVMRFIGTTTATTTASVDSAAVVVSGDSTSATNGVVRNVLVIPFPKPREEHARLVRIGDITSHYANLFETLQEMFESSSSTTTTTTTTTTTESTTTKNERVTPLHVHVCANYNSLLEYKAHGFELSATMRSLFAVSI